MSQRDIFVAHLLVQDGIHLHEQYMFYFFGGMRLVVEIYACWDAPRRGNIHFCFEKLVGKLVQQLVEKLHTVT